MPEQDLDNALVLEKLNGILEFELAGVVRYTHYANDQRRNSPCR
jgi:bacterioferritin (cytochrome b1)